MRRILTVFLAAVLSTAPHCVASARATDARSLMEAVSSTYRSVGTERETLEVVVVASPQPELYELEKAQQLGTEKGRGVTHKKADRYLRFAEDQKDRIYVLFSLPREDWGTGFLVWREPGKEQDRQWIYLPALKRARRVPVSSRQTFVGTNLLYEDVRELAGERTERYTYEDLGAEKFDGRDCRVILAKPTPENDSAYSSRKQWIDTERLIPLKIEYYDRPGGLWKVLRNSSLVEASSGIYRPGLTEMRDVKVGETTLLWFPDRVVGAPIPAETFTRDFLENPAN